MLARYNSDTKGFEWFKGFGNKLPELSKEVESFFDKIGSKGYEITENNPFIKMADDADLADKSFKEFLKTTKESGTIYASSADALAGYQSYLQSTAKATTIADLKTKALSVSMQLLSTIGWMAAITAITWAFGKLVGSINDAIHAAEIAREKSSELTEAWNSENTSIEKYPVKPISI